MRFWVFLWVASACGQVTTGSISGRVLDPRQEPVAHAEITLSQPDRGLVRTTWTDEAGFYLLAELAPATYTISAKASPFLPATMDVRLAVNTRLRASFRLGLASLTHSIDVVATVQLIPSDSSELGAVFDQARIQSLPLNRRDFLQLALLAPGVAPAVQDSELSSRGGFAMHAGGAREEFNSFLLDGVDNNDHYENTFALQPPVDTIQEFKIATSSYSAEYGRNGGAQVNPITRGGGNHWHGSLYEYLRNRPLDARNFFDAAGAAKLIRNQFGVTSGGPVVKDRTFFFVNFDGLRERRGLTRVAIVPTSAERAGDLSASGKPILDPFTRQPFPGGRIPDSRISPLGRKALELFPLPTGAGGAYLAQPVLKESFSQFHGRLDHRLSQAGQLTLRYGYGTQDLFEPYTEELTAVPGFGDSVTNTGHNAMIHHTQAISPRTFQSLRLGFSRTFREVLPQNHATDVGKLWGAGWLNLPSRDFGYPLFNVAGYSHAGDATQLPISRHISSYQVLEDVSLLRGAHSIKLGAELRNQRLVGFLDYFARGSLSFSGAISGTGISDLLLGFPSFGLQATFDNRQALRSLSSAFYVQDDWKIRSNLTLNLGLRYELQTPPADPSDRMSIFDPASGKVVNVGANGVPRAGIRTDYNNLAPRVGFAWTPAPNLVVRGGYGVYYDSGMLVVNSSLYFNPPYFSVRAFFPTATSLLTLDNPFPSRGGITPPPSPNTLSPDVTTGYLQHWNVNVQRQLGAATTMSAAYGASKGTHLIRSRDLNQPLPGPGDVASRRPKPAFGGIFFIESGANSRYQSLQLSLDRRLSRNFSLLASYTHAKSIDDTSAFLGSTPDKNFPQDSRNYRAERGTSSFDVPNRFVTAYVYTWRRFELRGITTLQSGQPFTPILRFDNSNTGNTGGIFGSDRPNLLRNPELDNRSAERWFDTQAFAIAAPYHFGNAGRNIVRGPGIANFDVALGRSFTFREGLKLTADAQSFNLFNHTQLDLPEHFADEPSTFGRILSAKPPRQLQFSLRFTW
jgi:outer membrane receptor protein involved in Fe transport